MDNSHDFNEPVAWIKYLIGAEAKPNGQCYDIVFVACDGYEPLYAAPKALAPEQVEAAWRAGWAACRDAEYVGQEAEDEAWGMSETCANADWESAAPKALEPTILKPFTPCVCHDETAKRYCKNKGKCSQFEAHGITKGTP